jgi:hypothetical protein
VAILCSTPGLFWESFREAVSSEQWPSSEGLFFRASVSYPVQYWFHDKTRVCTVLPERSKRTARNTQNYKTLFAGGLSFPSPERSTTMADRLIAFYPHRRNKDGSYDSICLNCLLTVASGKSEAELIKLDTQHVCAFSTLSQRTFHRNVPKREKPSQRAVL